MTPSCPRCRGIALQPFSTHGVAVLACGQCHGLWIDHVAATRVAGAALQDAAATPAEWLPCPMCNSPMGAWKAKEVVVDRCDAHGLWFDHAELERVIVVRPTTSVKTDSSGDAFGWVIEGIDAIVSIFI